MRYPVAMRPLLLRPFRVHPLALRLALFYMAIFTAVGIHLPFWPVWLKAQGLGPTEIGYLMAAMFLCKVLVNPVVGHVVDHVGDRRTVLVVLAAGSLAAFSVFALVDGFWALLALTLVATGLFASMMPIGENLAMLTTHAERLDYGRIRLWGSLTFIGAAVIGGQVLVWAPPDSVLWMMLGGLAFTLAACLALPQTRPGGTPDRRPAPFGDLLKNRQFLVFLGVAGLVQIGHMMYYAFATLYWRAAGLSSDVIGLLWAEGVLAEVVLFAFSAAVIRRVGPMGLILIGAAAGIVRWLVLGLTTDLSLLFAVQLLHACTFGCAHLGAMHFITRIVPTDLSARAQGLYSSVALGLAPGLAMPFIGPLYENLSGRGFLVMAVIAGLATLLALHLGRMAKSKEGL